MDELLLELDVLLLDVSKRARVLDLIRVDLTNVPPLDLLVVITVIFNVLVLQLLYDAF